MMIDAEVRAQLIETVAVAETGHDWWTRRAGMNPACECGQGLDANDPVRAWRAHRAETVIDALQIADTDDDSCGRYQSPVFRFGVLVPPKEGQ